MSCSLVPFIADCESQKVKFLVVLACLRIVEIQMRDRYESKILYPENYASGPTDFTKQKYLFHNYKIVAEYFYKFTLF